jgi:hypothetical protein
MPIIQGSSTSPYVPPPLGYIRGFAHHKNPGTGNFEVGTGAIELNNVMYFLNAGLAIARPGIANWNFAYVNKPAAGNVLAAGQFSFSGTAPVFDNKKQGWYDATGLKRCIGFFKDAGAAIHGYSHQGGFYRFDQPQQYLLAGGGLGTAWRTDAVGIPFNGIRWGVLISGWFGGGATAKLLRASNGDNGVAPNDNDFACASYNGAVQGGYNVELMTNTSGQCKFSCNVAASDIVCNLAGLYIPDGFAQ